MKKTYILSTILLLAMVIAGCKKGFLSQEVNPNDPSSATPQQILAGAEEVTAANVNTGFGTFGIWLGYYAPSGNYTISAVTEQYSFTNSSYSQFGTIYPNITNYTNLLNQGTANPAFANFAAIAKIMIAFDYQNLVDTYNDVPYLQAENSTKYLFPAYDSGQNIIYPDLLVQLDAAIALINASGSATSPGTSDIIFGGNMAKWKKFANTIKLRIAVRQSNIAAAKAGLVTELAKTSVEGYLDDVTFATANPGYINQDTNGGQQAPYWKTYAYTAANAEASGHATTRANTFFINFENTHGSDTLRLKQIYAPTNTVAETKLAKVPTPPNNADHIIGNQFGNDNSYLQNPNTSGLGPGIIISPTMNSVIISGADACLLLSEGVLTGLVTGPASATVVGAAAPAGSAQDYYQRAITANFVALVVPNAVTAAATYYNQPIVDVNWVTSAAQPAIATGLATGESASLRAIMTQKYIALFGYECGEMYNEYRRTALPDLLTPIGGVSARTASAGALGTGVVPNRIFFPSTETQTNAAAVAAEPAVSPFSATSLIFWARNVNP